MEIDLTKDHARPITIKVVLLTGVKGETKKEGGARDLGDEEHVAFHFDYRLSNWDSVSKFSVPKEAEKLLR